MPGLAAVLDVERDPRASSTIRRMFAAAPHRARGALTLTTLGRFTAGLGADDARDAAAADPSGGAPGVSIDAARAIAIVVDAHLTIPGDAAALVAERYTRFGARAVEHVDGHFAFVLWDEARERLFAARDAFGQRPLFWAEHRGRLVLASELESIAAAGVPLDVDDTSVLEHLLADYRAIEGTFFRRVRRVPPGHVLVAERGRVSVDRWFHAPLVEHGRGRAQILEDVRSRFVGAVAHALGSGPALAELSGGLDSSSIVCAAAHLYHRTGSSPERSDLSHGTGPGAHVVDLSRGTGSLTTVSAVYPGLACDETPFIDAVTRHTGVPSERFDGTCSDFADHVPPPLLHPGAPPTSGLAGERAVIAKTGARVRLSGSGGDQLFFERGVFRDLAAAHAWRRLVEEARLAPRYSTRSTRELLRDAAHGALPRWLFDARARLRRPHADAPPWLGEQLRPLVHARPPRAPVDGVPSYTQAFAWRWLTAAPSIWHVEVQELRASRLGVTIRFPFLDARLARAVLSVPWDERLPHGRMKALLRDALGPMLPPSIRERTHVTTFEPAVRVHVSRHAARLWEVVEDAPWRAERWVRRAEVARALASIDGSGWGSLSFVWSAVMLELWVRRVEQLDREGRTLE